METCTFCNCCLSSSSDPRVNYRGKNICARCLGELRRLAELTLEMAKSDIPGGVYYFSPEVVSPGPKKGD